MNGKTAKLLRKYGAKKGSNVKDLKRLWMSLPAKERFKKRQEMLTELGAKKI
ncbi:MAG: hypothetical protein JNM27_12240 [Leptospirales bacterium]|nr:hypothetical protein [Leptospirales bacterium]